MQNYIFPKRKEIISCVGGEWYFHQKFAVIIAGER